MGNVKTFGDVDARSLEQLERCMSAGDAEFGVLCADHHPGYSQPIGGGIAYEGYVSPSGVGYDIGCGKKAARTELTRGDLDALGGVEAVMAEITRRGWRPLGGALQQDPTAPRRPEETTGAHPDRWRRSMLRDSEPGPSRPLPSCAHRRPWPSRS